MSSSGRRYRFGELLGEGGFGVVYRAAMLGADGFEKPVAIKLLRLAGSDPRFAAEAQQRFRDEARLLGLLRHRAIVQVDSLVHIGGHQAVVMELVDGVSMRALVKRAPVPEGPAFEIVAEVSAALDAAWHRPGPAGKPLNVCHRDVKPANLQLTADGELKVLDFGIARADFQAREAATRSLAMGSVEYMSPLRLDFDDDGPAGDIYSLGCVLYELLVGEAFGRTSANPVSHQARFDANIGRVPGPARDLVAEMLRFAGADRPGARDVERRCRELMRGEPLGLRDWAREVVPECVAATPQVNGSWSGKLLAEDSDAVAVPSRSGFVVGPPTGVMPTVASDRVGSAVPAALDVGPSPGVEEPSPSAPTQEPLSEPLGSGPITSATVRSPEREPSSPATLPAPGGSGPVSGSLSGARKRTGAEKATTAGAAALGFMGISSIAVGSLLAVVAAWFGLQEYRHRAPPLDAPAVGIEEPPVAPPVEPPPAEPSAVEPAAGPAPDAALDAGGPGVPPEATPVAPQPHVAKKPKPADPAPVVDPGVAATIELSGNAEAVRLRGGDTLYALPKVPAGTYTVLATFDGKEVEAGSLTLVEAERVALKCKKASLKCGR